VVDVTHLQTSSAISRSGSMPHLIQRDNKDASTLMQLLKIVGSESNPEHQCWENSRTYRQ